MGRRGPSAPGPARTRQPPGGTVGPQHGSAVCGRCQLADRKSVGGRGLGGGREEVRPGKAGGAICRSSLPLPFAC
eukprot:233210-Chlamydomonas_euryale.AAC.8